MASDEGSDASPWLVLERVDTDPEEPTRRVGVVRFGGHHLRVVLDFGRRLPGFVEYVDIPELLGIHEPSQRAVIAAMTRVVSGQETSLPCDLTDEVRHSQPPFPLRPLTEQDRTRLDAAAAGVDLQVRAVQRTGSSPALVDAELVLDGQPMTVRARVYSEPGAVPVIRWLPGTRPDDLAAGQRRAIEQVLLRQPPPDPPGGNGS